MKIIILFIIIFYYSYTAFSQESFLPGYVIALNGDTLAGEILDQGDYLNSQKLIYRENENAIEQSFMPLDVKAYFISNGNYFESRIFEYYNDIPVKSLKLIANTSNESIGRSAYELIPDTAFLRVVVDGDGQLFLGLDKSFNKLYFIETPNKGFKQLIDNKTYSMLSNGSIKYHMKKTIADTLELLVSDCKDDLLLEKRKKYSLWSLIYLVEDYNTCMGSESELFQPKQKPKIKFGLDVGMNSTNVSARGKIDQPVEEYSFNSKQSFKVGGIIDWYFITEKENWAVQTELSYNQKGGRAKDYYYKNGPLFNGKPSIDTLQLSLDYEYIDLGLYAKYFLNSNKHKFRPYLNLGFILGFKIIIKNRFSLAFIHEDGSEYNYSSDYFPKQEFGIAGKFGALYNINKNFGIYGEFKTSFTELYLSEELAKFTNILFGFSIGVYL